MSIPPRAGPSSAGPRCALPRCLSEVKPEVAEVTMRAENSIELAGDDAARMQKLLDVIEDLDDVQDVYHNAELGAA